MELLNTGGTSGVPQDYADGYEWTLPSGWTSEGSSGTITTSSPMINLTPTGCSEGSLSVKAFFNCGGRKYSNSTSLSLARQSPAALTVTSTNYTGGACGNTSTVRFQAPSISCAKTYTWTFIAAQGQSSSGWATSPIVTNATNFLDIAPSGSALDAGKLVVTIELDCGKTLSTSDFALTYTAPAISVTAPICYGSSRTVTLNNVTNKIVTWGVSSNLTNQTPSATGTTIQVTATSSITRAAGQITATVPGCTVSPITPWVGPPNFPTPLNGPSQLTNGTSAVYQANNVGGSNGTYSWTIASPWTIYSSGPIANGHAAIVECKSVEIRRVYVTTSNLCGSGTTSKQIEGVAGCGSTSMSVYPNPAKGDFTVAAIPPPPCESYSSTNSLMSETALTTAMQDSEQPKNLSKVEIYNARGNKVFEQDFEGDKVELSGLGLKQGQYVVKMLYKGKLLEQRLLINK